MRRTRAAALAAPTAAVAAILIGSVTLAQESRLLRVFAAASLTEVVELLAERYPGARVEPSLGGSSALARQIRDGAPADVFLSASPDWIEFLREAGAIEGEPIVFARNRIVCIATRRRPRDHRDVTEPPILLRTIGRDGRVAIANEGVPAGEYARAALERLGLLDAFRPRLVGLRDVRAVLHAVERGELRFGFVYATDAKVAAVDTLFAFDPSTHPPIEYRAAVIRGARDAGEAHRFLDYLRGESARSLLADAGFAIPR